MPTAPVVSRAHALFVAACVLASSSALAAPTLPAMELHFLSDPMRVNTTTCVPADIQITDRLATGGPYNVTLTTVPSDVPVEFFLDTSCATAARTSFDTTSANLTVYLKSTNDYDRFGAIRATVGGAGAGAAAAVLPVQVGGREPSGMTIVGDPGAGPAVGGCSALMAVAFEDKNGFPVMNYVAGQEVSVKLNASGGALTFYSDAQCANATDTIPAWGNVAIFAYKGSVAGNFNVTATAVGTSFPVASRSLPVSSSTTPARVAFVTPPQTIPVRSDDPLLPLSSCSAPFTIALQGATGGRTPATELLAVAVSAVQGGSTTDRVRFFTDPKCQVQVSSANALRFNVDDETVTFFANTNRAGTYKVVAAVQSSSWYAQVGQPLEAAPGAPKKLVFGKQPGSFINGQVQLAAFPIKVALKDADDNVTQLPAPIQLSVTQSTEAAITSNNAAAEYPAGSIRDASWDGTLIITAASGAWTSKTLSLTAKLALPNVTPIVARSMDFLLLAEAPPAPKIEPSAQPVTRCEPITLTLGYVDPLAQSTDVFKVCLDQSAYATIASTTMTRDPDDESCVFGAISGGKEIVFKSAKAENTAVYVYNELRTVNALRIPLSWTEGGPVVCSSDSVDLTVTLDKATPVLGEEVLVDIRAKSTSGGSAVAKAIKLQGGSLIIKELVDTAGAVTLMETGDELRFANIVPDTIRLKAVVQASGAFTAVALDHNDREIGKSGALNISLQAPSEPVSFGCSLGGSSFALLAVLLVAAWVVARRPPVPVALRRNPRHR